MTQKLLITLLVLSYALNINAKSVHHDDICGGFDGRRLYLELGEHGTLIATNVSGSNIEDLSKEAKQCSLEIVSCSSCIISIQFSLLNIVDGCVRNASINGNKCECDYVWIYESPYEAVSGKRYCGTFFETKNESLTYKSKTRSTSIKFVYTKSHSQAFVLKYFAERNRHFINSYPKRSAEDIIDQYLTSPFFPKNYPKDLSVEYVLNCRTIELCSIKLIFTDFQISRSSLIEFFDWNGQRMFVTTGSLFRPPILESTGPSMVIRFYANGGTNTGFKLKYGYILGDQNNISTKINTDCGGLVDNLGGAITMMEMTEDENQMYNCFWIIKPPQGYLHVKTHLYAKVTKFEDFDGTAQLLVKEGLTSEGFLLANVTYPSNSKIKEHVVSINEGIYMSLVGTFNVNSKLEVVYSAFSYKDCAVGSDFLCQNERCISITLQCNGFDNCGDLSDEPEVCDAENKRKISAHVPNFYFPKSNRDLDLKTATIIFIISSLALMCLIVSLVVLLYKINKKGNNRRHLQNHLQSINDLLEESSRIEEVEIIISDDPPNYEAPPDYAEVIKAIDVNSGRKQKLNKKLFEKHANRLLPIIKDDIDTSSLSTTGSTSNLLPGSTSNGPVELTIPVDSTSSNDNEAANNIVVNAGTSNTNAYPENTKLNETTKWLDKDRRFEFNPINLSNSDRIGFFSHLRATNRHHCLSDSDLSSVMSFTEEGSHNKQSKIAKKSISTEKIS